MISPGVYRLMLALPNKLVDNVIMEHTSLSLLCRLQSPDEPDSWERLVELYTPLIRSWLRRYEVQDSDAEDLTQEVLLAVSKDLKKFEHGGQRGAFRGWMKAILVNRLRKFWRNRDRHPQARADSDIDARIAQLDDPASEMSRIWNDEHDQFVLRRLLEISKSHFAEQTWEAFRRVALEGSKPDVVAREMGVSLNIVCLSKSRVMRRLRQESDGLIESSWRFSSGR